ncbi:MAG TPA: AfsR/SARP family transcriptional regulator, partial [Actinokineospora sp.]|nr:AfsR/SARP family transcriptional regulator [Actinokineospora sp.]
AVSREAEQRIVRVVALAGVGKDDDVAGEVASALGVVEPQRGPIRADPVAGIVTALGPGPALLVLDNCEHVLRGAADLVHALVSATKDVRVLTTSRAPLGLSSESVYPLPELDLPTTTELFVQRARSARPGVDLPAAAVAELCAHLDGLPLAVELAAARVRVMSVAEIARGLDDRFTLLRGGPREAPHRHQTLHAVVDWSWHLLDAGGQAALRALSVFPGGFTVAAAHHLIGARAMEQVEHLVDQSLLKVVDTPAGTRFRMLETVREFSTARRVEAGETDSATAGFLAWAREFGVAHHDTMLGEQPFVTAQRVHVEQDNLLHALRIGMSQQDGPTVVATTAVLSGLWMVESNLVRGTALIEETEWFLSHYRPEPEYIDATRTAVTIAATYTLLLRGPRATRSLATLRALPPAPPTTIVRAMAAVLREARAVFGADPAALRELCDSDEPLLAVVAQCLTSYLREFTGDLPGALAAAELMLAELGTGSPWMRVMAHSRLGELCLNVERGEDARHHLRAAIGLQEELGEGSDPIGLRWALVLAHLQCGDMDEAERCTEVAALNPFDDGDLTYTFALCVRAEILLARGDVDPGLSLWRRAVDRLRTSTHPTYGVDRDLDPWALEVRAVTVVAHARHGRLDLVDAVVADLPSKAAKLLTSPTAQRQQALVEFPLCGALLLAMAMADPDARTRARLIALAEQMRFSRNFHPTMIGALARKAAETADRQAYADAVSEYACLSRDELRAVALASLPGRG